MTVPDLLDVDSDVVPIHPTSLLPTLLYVTAGHAAMPPWSRYCRSLWAGLGCYSFISLQPDHLEIS